MNNKESKFPELDNNSQDKDKSQNNPFPIINKPQLDQRSNYNLILQNYEMDNFKSEIKIYKHTNPSK
jgi:hypothetical protein